MKIVKPTFESLLTETDTIWLRCERIDGEITLVAGGIDKNGRWLDFPMQIKPTSAWNLKQSLTLVDYFMKEEGKRWYMENNIYSLIRKLCTNLN